MSRPRMPLRAAFPPPLPPGRAGDPGVVEPDGPFQRLWGDRLALMGGPAAILLQIAHPLVGAGVVEHSDYRSRPGHRLLATLDATLAITFGDREQAAAAAAAVGGRHRRVRGTLPSAVGEFPAGTPYSAGDPDLALWVYATLVRTSLRVHERYRAPLGAAERERYYRESKAFALTFRVPPGHLPGSWAQFCAYFDSVLPRLAVTPAVLDVARDLLVPRLTPPVPGAGVLLRAVTADLLPDAARRSYSLPLTAARRAQVAALTAATRRLWPRAPRALREVPHVRQCEERLRAG
ncbi:oxygenase MpaB family protein [Kineococcus xinjiangensis]|uniref:oxygenase MpaB family protein n=1 Tax=Kineococcus xinjiangensis TaxID=512762 RepID=UPI0011B003C8|nr:oxygenase MpaB family protein [Kineococcus xinjiangensis]